MVNCHFVLDESTKPINSHIILIKLWTKWVGRQGRHHGVALLTLDELFWLGRVWKECEFNRESLAEPSTQNFEFFFYIKINYKIYILSFAPKIIWAFFQKKKKTVLIFFNKF